MKGLKSWQRWAIGICWGGILAVVVCSFATAKDFPLNGIRFGQTCDSVMFVHYKDGVVQGAAGHYSAIKAGIDSWDTTISDISCGYHRCIFYLKHSAGDEWAGWCHDFNYTASSGSGPYSWTIYVSDGSTMCAKKQVSIYSLAGSQEGWGTTDTEGKVSLMADLTSYVVRVGGTLFSHSADTIEVTGDDQIDTTTGTSMAVVVTAPDSAEVCRVTGYVRLASQYGGTAAAKYGLITFTLPDQVQDTCSDVLLITGPQRARIDSTGRFQIDLVRSKCLSGQKYQVRVEVRDGQGQQIRLFDNTKKMIEVPDTTVWELSL